MLRPFYVDKKTDFSRFHRIKKQVFVNQVIRWSSAAAGILQSQYTVLGRVHSCFDRVVNIRTPTGRLMTLQWGERLQAPLALQLAGQPETFIPHLPVGALVVKHLPGAVAPSAALRLMCSGAIEWDGRIRPIPDLTALDLHRSADALNAWLMRHQPGCGLVPVLEVLFQESGRVLSGVCRRMYDALMPLSAGCRLSTTAILEMAERVLGLGDGLTPSGDDLLVGFLALLHATGRLEEALPSSARHQFLQYVMSGTSDLSSEFIRFALEGDFAEPLVLLVRSLLGQELHGWQSQACSLAAVGHSSGIDAMAGIVFGSRLLARSLER